MKRKDTLYAQNSPRQRIAAHGVGLLVSVFSLTPQTPGHPSGLKGSRMRKKKRRILNTFTCLIQLSFGPRLRLFCHFAVNSHGKRISLGLGLFIMNILMFFK